MKNNKKKFIQVFALALIMLLIASSTYAYFAMQIGQSSSTDITVTTSTVDNLTFETGDAISISATQSNFGSGAGNQSDDTYASATLVANNDTNEASANYYLYIKIDTNEFEYTTSDKTAELILTITDPDGNEVTSLSGLTYTSVTDGEGNTVSGFDITSKIGLITIAEDYLIESTGTNTQEWNIEVILVNLDSDQSDNAGKSFSASLVIQPTVYGNTLQAYESGSEIWAYTSSTTKIVFDDSGSTINIYDYIYDISESSDESILAYVVNNGNDTFTTYIVSDLPILGNANMSYWFSDFTLLEEIEGLDKLITSNVISMNRLFRSCISLTSLDLSGWDTSSVTDMYLMFGGTTAMSLESITFGDNWNTGNVTNMSAMFQNCSNLTELDLSNWDTSSVTTMQNMFNGCSGLTSLDLSNFDTSSVETMYGMFANCSSLKSLNLDTWNTSNVTSMALMFCGSGVSMALENITFGDNWDTSNVTNMSAMFQNCSNIIELDLSYFDTSKVTDMSYFLGGSNGTKKLKKIIFGDNWSTRSVTNMAYMFVNCINLTELDVSNWDTSNVVYLYGTFTVCESLSEIDVSNWDTSNVKYMDGMFENCSSLTSLDLSTWDTSKVQSMSYMFWNCASLTELDVSNWDTSKVQSMSYMFWNCASLTELDVSSFNTSNVTDMGGMFGGYEYEMKLTSITFGNGWDTSNVKYMDGMFENCSSLTSLDLSNWDTSNVTTMNSMFGGSYKGGVIMSLTSITFGSKWNTSNVTDMGYMFCNCAYLTTLDLSNWDTSSLKNTDKLFYNTSSLASLNLSNASFTAVTTYDEMFYNNSSSINVTVKDSSAYDFITARLSEYNGGTVVIA